MSIFTESNRWKHFVFAIPVAFVFTVLCTLGCAAGMEFKDKQWGGKWDWWDFAFTIAGGLVGQELQLIAIYFLFPSSHRIYELLNI